MKKAFFAVNGAIQPFVLNAKLTKKELASLSPIVAGHSGLIVTANFGQAEFTFAVCHYL